VNDGKRGGKQSYAEREKGKRGGGRGGQRRKVQGLCSKADVVRGGRRKNSLHTIKFVSRIKRRQDKLKRVDG